MLFRSGLLPCFATFSKTSSAIHNTCPYTSPLPRTYCYIRFGLLPVRSPLLRQSLIYFLFLRVLRCFSSPGSLVPAIYSPTHDSCFQVHRIYDSRVSPFGNLRVKRLIAANRSLSQLVTSFIGARCLGIHRTLLVA